MWRSLFMALGIFSVILGAEFLTLERVILAEPSRAANTNINSGVRPMPTAFPKLRDFKPPEWLPWTLLSCGAIVILWSAGLGYAPASKPSG